MLAPGRSLAYLLLLLLAAAGLAIWGCGGPRTTAPPVPPSGQPSALPSPTPSDPFLRGANHWVFPATAAGMGHLWGQPISDPAAASGQAWSTAPGPRKVTSALVFGPYYKGFSPGKYRADYYLEVANSKGAKAVGLDVFVLLSAAGATVQRTLATKGVSGDTGGQYRAFALDFEVPADLAGAGVEFRVHVPGQGADVRVDRIEVTKP